MTQNAVPARNETANDRLKKSWDNWFWGSMIVAVAAHFSIFQFWPDMTAEDVSFTADELEAVEIPPEVEIPPPPEAIQRPATPVISEANIDEDITIAPTTFEDNPIDDLPPPPTASAASDVSGAPSFTPYDVAPTVMNAREVQRALEREYPALLKDAGIGGVVRVHFYIDESGIVQNKLVDQSSGHPQLDEAALAVAEIMRFSPAQNRDKNVAVWVSLPITFQVR